MFNRKPKLDKKSIAIEYLRSLDNKDYKAVLTAVNLYRKGDIALDRVQRNYGVDKTIEDLGGFIDNQKLNGEEK